MKMGFVLMSTVYFTVTELQPEIKDNNTLHHQHQRHVFTQEDITINITVPACSLQVHTKIHLNAEKLQAVPKKTKLSTYCLFKETMGIENYIKYNLSSSERSAMAQFRFGILPLNIETGRFRNQALEERLCTLCEFNEIEDESC